MRYLVFSILFVFKFNSQISSQTIRSNQSIANYVKRMYEESKFEGVKLLNDATKNYLISVVILDKGKYSSESIMSRVANVKARSQASNFINGSNITTDLLIVTSETKSKEKNDIITKSNEIIHESSSGFINGMEFLISFDAENNQFVYVLFKEIKK